MRAVPDRAAYFFGPQLETLANYYAHVIERVSAAGVRVCGYAPERPPLSAGVTVTFPVERAPYEREVLSPRSLLRSMLQAWRLGRTDPEGVFTLIMTLSHLLYGIPLRMLNRRCVFLMSGIGVHFTSQRRRFRVARLFAIPVYRYLLSGRYSRVVTQNREDHDYVLRTLRADPEKAYVMPGCGVDTNRFPFIEDLPANARPVVLVPARIVREKGILEAVRASEMLRQRGVGHEMWFTYGIDRGNPLALSDGTLHEFAARNEQIRFLGWQPCMEPLYRACDIVCLPTYAEGLPSALLEASACGRPIVTTDVRGCREVVTDRVTGLLVPPRSAEALASALATLIGDEGLRQRLRRNAYTQFLERFTRDQSADALLPAMRSLGLEVG
jgi:glycosyltransferase involved in cell wall biosynthesis